jgi:TonB-linked SusC/RagA family outer membrane protein
MRSKLLFLLLAIIITATSWAQTKIIKGRVIDETGKAVEGASITVKGTKSGVAADGNGAFSISAKSDDVLIVSATNFTSIEVKITNDDTYVINISRESNNIDEVVVTALNIKKNRNTLPYAAQTISGEDVSRARTANAASSLSGKIAGVQIIQNNGIGGSTNVVIRGAKSVTGNNQALFVVDGVPVDNSNTNSGNQRTGRGGYDYGNAAADINPDDIESITVLKGAASTALYGSRAANGVIMITTKKGKRGMGITLNSGVIVGRIDKSTFPTYQKEYGAGYSDGYQSGDGFLFFDVDGDGVKDRVVPTSEDASFGTKFDPNLMVYHWSSFDPASPNYKKKMPWIAAKHDPFHFYETAVTTNNSIFLDGSTDKGMFKLGYTRNDEHGVLPNSRVLKNIVNFSAGYDIMKSLNVTASGNYSKVDGKGRYGTGYSGLNPNQTFRQWHQTNVDILEQKEAYFRNRKNVTWNWASPSTTSGLRPLYTDNFYWTRYENIETDTRSRIFGNVTLNYKVTDWLNLLGRISVDNYTELQEERVAVGSQITSGYSRFDRSFNETNYDLMATFDKNITHGLNLKALAGVNQRKNTIRATSASTNGGLVVPGLYSIANSKGTVAAMGESYQPKAVDGYFGGVTLEYQKFLTLDATIRRDRSSTLPVNNNGYNYYAVSGSWLISKHIQANWLSSAKLRLNYATVGNDAPWGSIKDVYDQANPFGSSLMFSLPSTKNNNDLRPEKTESKEIGIEASFLKNRLGFDVTYYHTNTLDQILPASVTTATGFSSTFVNAGNVENKGIELSVTGAPFKTKNFSWDITLNWSTNKSRVLSLYNESKNLQLGSFQGGVSINATLGEPYGTIQGKTWKTLNGERLVLADGTYDITSTTTNVIGNINPDWIGGLSNNFKYKNLSLSFLVDVRRGGDVWSLDMYYSAQTGLLPESAGLNDLGKPVRNALADGGGIILPGVTADGKANEKRVVLDANGPAMPPAAYVYDASYAKLRELALTYSIPNSLLTKVNFIKGIDLSLIGRNLWIMHKNLPYSDPEENLSSGNIQGYQSGAYPTTRTLGINLKVKF